MKFGREVRRRRQALDMTLEELAERSQLTPNYIGSIEAGHRDPSLSTVLALAKGLDITAGELLGGVAKLAPASLEAARLFESVSPEAQDAVLRLLRAIAVRRVEVRRVEPARARRRTPQ